MGAEKNRPLVLVAVGIAIFALIVGCVFFLPSILYPSLPESSLQGVDKPYERIQLREARRKLQNDARTTLLQGLGGAFFLVTAFFTWQQIQNSRSQLFVAGQQLAVGERGQITERLTRAVEQLGMDKSVEVRVGGIYALQRIANESSNDEQEIENILAAYLRVHAKANSTHLSKLWNVTDWTEKELAENALYVRAPDVQAALTAIGNMVGQNTDGDRRELYLFNLDLSGAYLANASFTTVSFYGSHCELINLKRSRLTDVAFFHSDLRGAVFENAVLNNVRFSGADLTNSLWDEATLIDLDFRGSKNLDKAELSGATATRNTLWPDEFEFQKAGVTLMPDDSQK